MATADTPGKPSSLSLRSSDQKLSDARKTISTERKPVPETPASKVRQFQSKISPARPKPGLQKPRVLESSQPEREGLIDRGISRPKVIALLSKAEELEKAQQEANELKILRQEAKEANERLKQKSRVGLESVLQKINPKIATVYYSKVEPLASKELNAHIKDSLPTKLTDYIVAQDEEAAGSPTVAQNRLKIEKEKLQATLTAIYLLHEKEPVVIRDWFLKNNRSLGAVSPARALREDQLGEVLQAARIYSVYSE